MLLAAASALAAETVYKWVDEHGVVHYSDQPHPGAERLELGPIETFTPPAAPTTAAEPAGPEAAGALKCAIVQPAPDAVFQNAWSLDVQLAVQPQLRPTHRVFFVLDGERTQLSAAATQFTISPIHRGSHTLAAAIESAAGEVLCTAGPVTFHVHQPSVKSPIPSRRPR